MVDLQQRSELATELKYGARQLAAPLDGAHAQSISFPPGLTPTPQPMATSRTGLPLADVVVMVDTEAEAEAASDVLTPGHPARTWKPYVRNYDHFLPQFGPIAPARKAKRLGSYMLTLIGKKRVLAYKTESHMHEDAIKLADGSWTLPLKDILKQLIDDVRPEVFLSSGTSGGVYPAMPLGDVVVSRAAKFACKRDFGKAAYNGHQYESHWTVPRKHIPDAEHLMASFATHLALSKAPDAHCDCTPPNLKGTPPAVHCDGDLHIPEFHPILTTDYFEFGTDKNELWKEGMAVEMDDACLGLACSELSKPPHWACVRNVSDPVINGNLPEQMQDRCAEYYYRSAGYWTSVNSALTAWAIAAGL